MIKDIFTLAFAPESSTTQNTNASQKHVNAKYTSQPGEAADTKNSMQKIKTLPPSVVKDIEQKNMARKLSGLSPILIRVRPCLTCGSLFESSGNRTCGCSARTAGSIAGREII